MVCREPLLRYTKFKIIVSILHAMVCREPLLRYTLSSWQRLYLFAMVCREPLLRYTRTMNPARPFSLWFAGNRC